MNILRRIIISVVCLLSSAYGLETLPQLRWVKPVSETTISPNDFYGTPTYIFDYPEDAFLCVDGSKMVVLSTKDGSVKRTVTGLKTETVSRSRENGYVFTTDDTITLMDSTLEKVWSKRVLEDVSILDAVQTTDSGFAALGSIGDTTIIMIKTDRNLDTVWTRVIPYPDQNEFATPFGNYYSRITETAGGYIACGTYLPQEQMGANGCVAKFSYTGVREWTETVTGLTLYDITGVENGVVMTGMMDLSKSSRQQPENPGLGKTLYFPVTGIAFVHVGANGEILINNNLGGLKTPPDGLNPANIGRMIGKSGNIFIIASYMHGEIMHSNTDITEVSIIAVDGEGTKQWSIDYSGHGSSSVNAQPLASGDLVVLANDSLFYYSNTALVERYGKRGSGSVSQQPFFSVSGNRVSFTLEKTSATDIKLYTSAGALVRNVDMGRLAPGRHEVLFTGVAKGSYVVRCSIGDGRKVVQGSVVLY